MAVIEVKDFLPGTHNFTNPKTDSTKDVLNQLIVNLNNAAAKAKETLTRTDPNTAKYYYLDGQANAFTAVARVLTDYLAEEE